MIKRPVVNAILASLYITLVATIMFNGKQLFGGQNTVLIPIAMISLFTLSAAVMGYLFLFQPAMLYFDGHKKNAIKFFLETLTSFGVITLLVFLLLFSRILG